MNTSTLTGLGWLREPSKGAAILLVGRHGGIMIKEGRRDSTQRDTRVLGLGRMQPGSYGTVTKFKTFPEFNIQFRQTGRSRNWSCSLSCCNLRAAPSRCAYFAFPVSPDFKNRRLRNRSCCTPSISQAFCRFRGVEAISAPITW